MSLWEARNWILATLHFFVMPRSAQHTTHPWWHGPAAPAAHSTLRLSFLNWLWNYGLTAGKAEACSEWQEVVKLQWLWNHSPSSPVSTQEGFSWPGHTTHDVILPWTGAPASHSFTIFVCFNSWAWLHFPGNSASVWNVCIQTVPGSVYWETKLSFIFVKRERNVLLEIYVDKIS